MLFRMPVPDPPDVLQQTAALGSRDVVFVDGASQSEVNSIEDSTLADAVPTDDHQEAGRNIEPRPTAKPPEPLHFHEFELHFSLLRRAATSFGVTASSSATSRT